MSSSGRIGPDVAGSSRRAAWLRGWHYQLAVLVAIVMVSLLAYLARTAPYFAVDVEITRAIQSLRSPVLVSALRAIGWIGFPPQVDVVVGLVIVALFVAGRRIEAALLLLAGLAGAGLWYWITAFIDRPRPSAELVHVATQLHSGSFPSGHVLNLTAIFGFLAYLAVVHVADVRWRALLVTLLALPVATIGVARVYDGAHWPSDVLGGYLIGGILLALTIQVYRRAVAKLRTAASDTDSTSPPPDVSSSLPVPSA